MEHTGEDLSDVSVSELVKIAFAKKEILTAYSYAIISDWHRAQDVVQESLLLVAGKTEIDQRTRGSLFPWIKGIVRRKSLEELRRIRREIPVAEETLLDLLSEEIDPFFNDSAEERLEEMVDKLRKCIGMLPEHARTLLFDFYHEGKSGKELAEMSGRNEGAIRKQLHFLRGKLRKCLGERLGDKLDTRQSGEGSDWFVSEKWSAENAARSLDAVLREAAFPIAAARCHAMDRAVAEDSSFLNLVKKHVRSGAARPSRLGRASGNPVRLVVPGDGFELAAGDPVPGAGRNIIRFPWRKAAAAILMASAAWGTLALRQARHSQTVAMTVTETDGGAILWRNTEQTVLEKGDRLLPGDWIETRSGTQLVLDSEGIRATYRINGASRFGLLDPPFSWFVRQRLELAEGGIAAVVDPKGRSRRLEILSGGFSSLVSGTRFLASTGGEAMTLGVDHGEVRLRDREGHEITRVSGGETAVATGSGDSTQVKKFGGEGGRGVVQEIWWADVEVIANKPRHYMKGEPDLKLVRPSFESGNEMGDYYVSRMSAWLIPPETGDYVFWISCDNLGSLTVREEGESKGLLRMDYGVPRRLAGQGWPRSDDFSWEASQGSKAIRLQKGRRYSLTAILRELEGEDFMGIGWTRPGSLEPEIIDGTHLRVK